MHLGSDLLSFIISLVAIYLSKKPPTKRLTWGYYRAGMLKTTIPAYYQMGVNRFVSIVSICRSTRCDIECIHNLDGYRHTGLLGGRGSEP